MAIKQGDVITAKDMNDAFDLKADKDHTHSIEDIDGLQVFMNNAFDLKENKANKKTTLTNSNTDYPTNSLVTTELNKKQNKLTAGTGMTISGNTILIDVDSNITISGKWEVPTFTMTAPTNLKVTNITADQITISWSAVSGAISYNVFYATTINGSYSSAGNTDGTTFTLTVPSQSSFVYYLKVSADPGNLLSTALFAGKPATPTPAPTLSLSPPCAARSIVLNWNTITGAMGYKIYRSTSSNGTYTYLSSTTGNSYSDGDLTVGNSYYYKVSAYSFNFETNQSSSVGRTVQ